MNSEMSLYKRNMEVRPGFIIEQVGKIEEMDRDFDLEFWQRQDSTARFSAVWELVVYYHSRRGINVNEFRLQRTVEEVQRQ